ncbi:multiprotein-bridging factor 1 family protein [Catenulispora yoronensis]
MNIHTGTPANAALRTGPFAEALRAAITARGLSLDSLQRRLSDRGVRVGTATLSCWQNGRRRPERPDSLRAVSALEEILGLPGGSLLVLLGPPRPAATASACPPAAASTGTSSPPGPP